MFQGDLISNSGRKKIHLGLSVTAMIDCALLVHNEYIYSDTSNLFWQKSAQSLENKSDEQPSPKPAQNMDWILKRLARQDDLDKFRDTAKCDNVLVSRLK